ncbi:MAG: thiamine biosynthesis protein ThiS [Hadesarchaea archaeon]|nr:MAG: thiamine biosynthesis protein ThiS [Hadesarchaea archaeon]TDA36419.1 MAG: thiamine biosynthesis protein ThiS [Hadesarchaea archaeon]
MNEGWRMKIRVRILEELEEREIELPEGATVEALLSKLGLKEEGIVVIREKKIIEGREELREGDRIRILPVAIGG